MYYNIVYIYREKIKTWDRNILVLLVRAAARGANSLCAMQLRVICSKIDRRYNDKPTIDDKKINKEIWNKMGITSGKKNES